MKDYLNIVIETPNDGKQEVKVEFQSTNMIETLLRKVADTFKSINPSSEITVSAMYYNSISSTYMECYEYRTIEDKFIIH
jgi:hypothetical protein